MNNQNCNYIFKISCLVPTRFRLLYITVSYQSIVSLVCKSMLFPWVNISGILYSFYIIYNILQDCVTENTERSLEKNLQKTVQYFPNSAFQKFSYITTIWTDKSCKTVLDELTPNHAQEDVCHPPILAFSDDKSIRRTVTCDKKWVNYSNHDTPKQWLDTNHNENSSINKLGLTPN